MATPKEKNKKRRSAVGCCEGASRPGEVIEGDLVWKWAEGWLSAITVGKKLYELTEQNEFILMLVLGRQVVRKNAVRKKMWGADKGETDKVAYSFKCGLCAGIPVYYE